MTSGQKSSKRGLKLVPFFAIELLAGTHHAHGIEVRDFSCYARAIDALTGEELLS